MFRQGGGCKMGSSPSFVIYQGYGNKTVSDSENK